MIAGVATDWDVVIVGAGPAGLAAASMTAEAGLSTLVIDENPGPGGQIYRAIETTPSRDRTILGADYWEGAPLVAAARASRARLLTGTTVWSLDRDCAVGIAAGGIARMLRAQRVIIATGALERPFPIPGWTLPGVLSVGAGQTPLKASGVIPQGRTIIAGLGPLLWLYAAQVLRAGGTIDAILETTPRRNYRAALPHLAGFLRSGLALKGLSLMREVRAKTRVVTGVTALAAEGEAAVHQLRYTARGQEHTMPCDTLLLHQGVVPQVNLAMAAGIAHTWDPLQLCFVPVLRDHGQSDVPGIAIAGDSAGIGGAWVAEARGRHAAIGVIRALRPELAPDEGPIRALLARHQRGRPFLDVLYQPPEAFRRPVGETIVCRCEEVTAADVRDTVRTLQCEGPNQLKAFLRCGMGPCQGRLCGLTVTELIAEETGRTPGAVGHYRLRPPVKPISLGELASIPADDAAERAVVRI